MSPLFLDRMWTALGKHIAGNEISIPLSFIVLQVLLARAESARLLTVSKFSISYLWAVGPLMFW